MLERTKQKREGLGWKIEHEWEGRDRVRAKKGKEGRELEKMWDRCIFESDNEFMKL